jgi:HAD superfamily hydrolase (TIGR01459 family)
MDDLSRAYPIWLCDVWGVVHDGQKPIAAAVAALMRHRAEGGKVIFITNAPRPKATIQAQLDRIGVSRSAYDDMVTSGDVTRHLMVQLGRDGLFHLGPALDEPLFKGLDVKRVALAQAKAVVCTGFLDETRETAKDYLRVLTQMQAMGLTMICANPDKVVRKGDKLVPCAGAIAEEYAAMGGKVLMAGKPFAPIYDEALKLAGEPDRAQVLAIGDGPETDIEGAVANGLHCVFISGGINVGSDVEAKVRAKYPDAKILASMPELYWA